MGTRNREGALYMATGIDVSGLYAGRREAIGIIKAMTNEITSFDVFSGIGISAATAFAKAAKSSYDFEKEFHKNMLEVATISAQVNGSMTDFMNRVISITQEIPVTAPEAAKALYQIVSAGHDGANGMKILEVSARSAIGGMTDTATAADAITTLLNAYKLNAEDAERVSDQLFTTARLGKTTFGELGQSIAQVAPIAASYGVEMDQVLAAVATLTKSGTPRAQAMTQIRASIIGTSKVLGDGAFNTHTFQEALDEVATMAGGSESKLRELIPEVEAVNGVLGMTGIKAQDAASDLKAMNDSVGATEKAFQKMMEDVDKQMTLLSNNIQATLRPMGEAILKNVSEAAKTINHGFETGDMQNSLENMKKLLIGVAGAFLTYKSAAIGASTAEALSSAKITISNNLKQLQNQITGESIIAKEKERVYQEAYNASLEKTITEEQRAKLAKLDLKAGSQEYIKALADQASQEKENADSLVESLTKNVAKDKERLAVAQENLDMSQKAVAAAKAEFDTAFEANDLAGVEIAQTKMNAAAKREEAAATNVNTTSKKLKSTESKLLIATTTAETATTRVNTAATGADAAVKDISTIATNRLKIASLGLWNVMKANPLGTILTMASLATTAYMLFADSIKKAETAQDRLNRLNKAAADNMANEQAELRLLLSVAKNELVSKTDREKAIKKLNDISPEYLGNLSLENIRTKEAADSIDAYTKAIGRNAKAKTLTDEMNPLYREQLKLEQELYALQKKSDDLNANKPVFYSRDQYYKSLNISAKIKNKTAQKAEVDKQIQDVLDMYNNELSSKVKSKKVKVDIPVNIQLEAEQSNLSALMKQKEEIEARINNNKSKGFFVDTFDTAQLAVVNNELTITNERIEALNKNILAGNKGDTGSISKEIADATQKISTLKQSLADLRSGKIQAEAGKTVQSAIEEKTKELKAAEDTLAVLTGRDKSSEKKSEDEQKKQLEKQKAIFAQLLELRMQNQQDEINLMKDGSDKKKAQIELDYDKEITAILAKEKEWKEAQGGKLTSDQTTEIHGAFKNAWVKREQSTGVVGKEQLEEEKRMMNEHLKEYGTYLEKRQSIIELYNDKIAKATTQGEKLSLGEEMKKTLAGVDDEAQKKTSIITQLFADMSKKSVADMRAIADEAESFLSFLESGEYSSDNAFGITKEQFDTLRKSPDQLKSIKDEIVNVRNEANQCETSFNKISGGLKKIFSARGDMKQFNEGLAEVSDGMNSAMQAGQFLSNSLSELGDAFGNDTLTGIADGVGVAMDAMSSAMDGAKAGAAFGPWGAAAGAAIGMVTSLASSFAKIHDAKNEKRIQVLQEQIDVLDKSYEKLGESIEKAYSKDASNLISQQNKMLEQQKVLIRQQIREEEDKKKTDDDRIKEWREQLEEIDKTLADNKEKAVDAIFGEDLKSAIENFASAYAEAWASGEDRAESAKDTVKNMMRQMVTESIKAAMQSSKSMEKIREKLKEFYADNVLSGWEQDYIYNMAENLQKELDKQFGWADSLMKDEKTEEDVSDNSLKGAYSKASQESIDLLAGQTGAVRVIMETIKNDIQPIREQMRLIYDMQREGWQDVKAIRDLTDKVEKNTERIADIAEKLDDSITEIGRDTRRSADALDGGTINAKIKM